MRRRPFFIPLLFCLAFVCFGHSVHTITYFDGGTLGPWEVDHSFPDLYENYTYTEIKIDAETHALDWQALRKHRRTVPDG